MPGAALDEAPASAEVLSIDSRVLRFAFFRFRRFFEIRLISLRDGTEV